MGYFARFCGAPLRVLSASDEREQQSNKPHHRDSIDIA